MGARSPLIVRFPGTPEPHFMDPQSAPANADRLRVPRVVFWMLFVAALVIGLALFFQNADRIVPMLDVVTGR